MHDEPTAAPRISTHQRTRTADLVGAALIAALLAASAWITLPLGTVPVTLQVFVVVLAALLLSPGPAAAALGVYLVLGAAGLPVFSGASGGVGVLMGPTGGYLLGFLAAAGGGAQARGLLTGRVPDALADAVTAALAIAVIYAMGVLQLSIVTNAGLPAAFAAGALPFIAVDAAKALVAVAVAGAVRRARVATRTY